MHTAHRGVLSRVFTPKKMNALEPQIREFCAGALDPLIGGGGFDFVADLGAQMPIRVIGMLLGIPPSRISRRSGPTATSGSVASPDAPRSSAITTWRIPPSSATTSSGGPHTRRTT